MSKYNDVTKRILVDIDNERRKDCDVVGLTKSGEDYIINYEKEKILLHEGDYVYMYTEDVHLDGEISYIFQRDMLFLTHMRIFHINGVVE